MPHFHHFSTDSYSGTHLFCSWLSRDRMKLKYKILIKLISYGSLVCLSACIICIVPSVWAMSIMCWGICVNYSQLMWYCVFSVINLTLYPGRQNEYLSWRFCYHSAFEVFFFFWYCWFCNQKRSELIEREHNVASLCVMCLDE